MISVIVPIYNVAPYLRKCLDSLLAQSFRDIEVILIDDGSTDESGEIAEEYSSKGFRVFHTENKGLSAARNLGVKKAVGSWIMFVDSDDWVAKDFCETPYREAIKHQADIVVFEFCSVKKQKTTQRKRDNLPCGIVSKETALEYSGVVAWNKLYKKSLFDDICFPEGRVYEDLATTHKLICKADRILLIRNCLYYHLDRENNITSQKDANVKKDAFLSAYERYNELRKQGYSVESAKRALVSCALSLVIWTKPSSEEIYIRGVNVLRNVKGFPKWMTKKRKVALALWRKNRRLFHFLCDTMLRNR